MSWPRQIKMLASLETSIVAFTAWTALISLLFKKIPDYRLFFLSLGLIFIMQYFYTRKNSKYLAVILPLSVSIPFLFVLFDGTEILYNLLFLIVNVFINLKLEELSIEYEEYRQKVKQGAIILGVMALVSLWLEKSAADYIYRFIVNYIIVAVVFLRESRAYCYKVISYDNNQEKIKSAGIIKKFVIDILLKYGIVIISTIIFTTDSILSKSIGIINAFSKAANFIIGGLVDILGTIIGPILIFVVDKLSGLLLKTNFSVRFEDLIAGLRKIGKNVEMEKGGATSADIALVTNTFKAIVLLIIVLFILDAVYKMKFLKIKNELYSEEKEKIFWDRGAHKDYRRNRSIASLFKKVFIGNKTLKERILATYRKFEKMAYKVQIYKLHMTATELKDKTRLSLKDYAYLDEMTKAYNEVKFSSFEPTENQLDLVRKAVDNVKKQLP